MAHYLLPCVAFPGLTENCIRPGPRGKVQDTSYDKDATSEDGEKMTSCVAVTQLVDQQVASKKPRPGRRRIE